MAERQTAEQIAEHRVVSVQWQGRTKYTYYDDGIVKITRYKKRKIYWGRIFAALVIFVLLAAGIVQLIKAALTAFANDKTDIQVNSSLAAATSSAEESAAEPAVTDESSAADSSSSTADSAAEPAYSNMNLTVCIDPGHGDYDKGAVTSDEKYESDQDLEIGLKVKEYLESCGVSVIMTRSEDVQVSLSERCAIANQGSADFFVSLHRNSVSDNASESGVEIWVNSNQPQYDTALAQNILTALGTAGISQDRGVKYGYSGWSDQNYQVNMDTVMPSCLIELGFMTNDTDNELFETKQTEYAKAIGDGIIKTAIDLGVCAEDGTRKLSEQLLSDGKANVTQQY